MSFLTLLAIQLALTLLYVWLVPTTPIEDGPADFRPPEPREGEPIPVVFGTVKIAPAVTWFGNASAKRVTVETSSLAGLITQDVPVGYDYFCGMQLTLCHGPVDEVLNVYIGEFQLKRRRARLRDGAVFREPSAAALATYKPEYPDPLPIDRAGTTGPFVYNVDRKALFGGPEEGGGVYGRMDFYWGTEAQAPNDYLGALWGVDITPNYRGVCYAVLRDMNMGKNPSPPPWMFVLKRIPDVLGQSAYVTITDADGNETANAAECIYEILTNSRWGVGMSTGDIDLTTFQAVGQTLHTEGLGYNGALVTDGSAWRAIQAILQHINGILYTDPLTGLIGIKLIRADYDIATIQEFTESSATLENFRRGSWAEVINEVAVNYVDIARKFSDRAAQAQNLAAIQAMQEIVTQEYDLKGLSTHALAQDAAMRALAGTSVPITRGRLITTRAGYDLYQGMPFKINYPHYGITNLVCRVTRIDYGSLTEGRISIEFVQDLFNYTNPYGTPGDYTDNTFCGPLTLSLPDYDPKDDPGADFGDGVTYAFEVPYWHLGAAERRCWTCVTKTGNADYYWIPWISELGADWTRNAYVRQFHALGILDADMPKTTAATLTTLTVRNLGDMQLLSSTDAAGRVAGKRLAIILNEDQEEIIAWETITDNDDGTFTLTNVMRGVLDTVPLTHYEGARVLFYWNNYTSGVGAPNAYDVTNRTYAANDVIGVRPERTDFEGATRNYLEAEPSFVVVNDRASAPYPPGKVTLNSNEYSAWPTSTSGDVTLGWTHRSRTLQTTVVAQDDATAYTLEGTIDIEVMVGGKVVRTFTGLTGTSQVYTYANRTADDADLTKKTQFRIIPKGTGTEVGFPRVTPPFLMNA